MGSRCSGVSLPNPEPSLWSLLDSRPDSTQGRSCHRRSGRQLHKLRFETFSVNVSSSSTNTFDPAGKRKTLDKDKAVSFPFEIIFVAFFA